ncbi:MAG: alpha/beta hydrolase, partial [Gemmatimonadaceae bacterium]
YWERLPLWASLAALPEPSRSRLRTQRLKNNTLGLANSLRGAGAGVDERAFERPLHTRTPVRLVLGAFDTKYIALGRFIQAGIPGSTASIVEGSGHMVHLEQAEQFHHLVRSSLNEMVSASGSWR